MKLLANLVLFVLFGAGVGLLAGSKVTQKVLQDSFQELNDTIVLVKNNSYAEIKSGDISKMAISGMFLELDPHSNYFNTEAFKRVVSDKKDHYFGVGMSISKRGEKITVTGVNHGSPSKKAGMMRGDVLTGVNGNSLEGKTTTDAVEQIRGKKGTKVELTIERMGVKKPFNVMLVRDSIPLNSVQAKIMMDNKIGYIFLSEFKSSTGKEMRQAVKELQSQGMEQLILDLRGNPGGTLGGAIEVSDLFVHNRKIIVSIRGRNAKGVQDYPATRGYSISPMPVVLLINHQSASASEIVAGAVQDYDLGLLVGESTFGKGLVQTEFPLSYNRALWLTTAHYYTPLGRLIQRPYEQGKGFDNYYFPNWDDVAKSNFDLERHHTSLDRAVMGGGGVTPDVVVKAGRRPNDYVLLRFEHNAFMKFVKKNESKWSKITSTFTATDNDYDSFIKYVEQSSFKKSFESKKLLEIKDDIKDRLTEEIVTLVLGNDQGRVKETLHDPVVKKAMQIMPNAVELLKASQAGSLKDPVAFQNVLNKLSQNQKMVVLKEQ